ICGKEPRGISRRDRKARREEQNRICECFLLRVLRALHVSCLNPVGVLLLCVLSVFARDPVWKRTQRNLTQRSQSQARDHLFSSSPSTFYFLPLTFYGGLPPFHPAGRDHASSVTVFHLSPATCPLPRRLAAASRLPRFSSSPSTFHLLPYTFYFLPRNLCHLM